MTILEQLLLRFCNFAIAMTSQRHRAKLLIYAEAVLNSIQWIFSFEV